MIKEVRKMLDVSTGVALAAVGAGISMGAAAIGAGIGVGIAGAAVAGAIAEDPNKFGTALVFQALPQTQGIYGFLGAVLIMIGTGILGGFAGFESAANAMADLAGTTPENAALIMGLAAVGGGLSVGLAGLSAIGQGITAAGSIGAVSKEPGAFGKCMVLTVMSETFAVFGLLITILILVGLKLLGA